VAIQHLCDSCGAVMPNRAGAQLAMVYDSPREFGCHAVRIKLTTRLEVLNNDEADPDICDQCLSRIAVNALAEAAGINERLTLPPEPKLAVIA
jgi:hypothetical protein